jgi:hypothetical protein
VSCQVAVNQLDTRIIVVGDALLPRKVVNAVGRVGQLVEERGRLAAHLAVHTQLRDDCRQAGKAYASIANSVKLYWVEWFL